MYISKAIFKALPSGEKLRVLDCGAKGGNEETKWGFLEDRVIIYGFDPDKDECERLNLHAKMRGTKHFYYPLCLGGDNSDSRKFYMTKQEYSHSLYPPDEKQNERWKQFAGNKIISGKDNLSLSRVIDIKTTNLDTWAEQNNISDVDYIKLDVQGAELEILSGGRNLLKKSLGLEIEVEFTELYIGQPLFADVDNFMRKEGFTFFNFLYTHNTHFGGRMKSPISLMYKGDHTFEKQIIGQLLTADALYLVDPISHNYKQTHDFSLYKILKLSAISEICGQIEYAFEILLWLKEALNKLGNIDEAGMVEDIYLSSFESYKRGFGQTGRDAPVSNMV